MIPSHDHWMIIGVFCCVIISASETTDAETLHRERRQLLWTNSTLIQLNIGVTTPTPIKTVNVGWAFQANFQLPWNRTQIPFDILEANSGYGGLSRRKRELGDYEGDSQLYHFYKYVEDILNSYGHNGTSCVLRTLCELGAEPLHSDDGEDLLHELATYILKFGVLCFAESRAKANTRQRRYLLFTRATQWGVFATVSIPLQPETTTSVAWFFEANYFNVDNSTYFQPLLGDIPWGRNRARRTAEDKSDILTRSQLYSYIEAMLKKPSASMEEIDLEDDFYEAEYRGQEHDCGKYTPHCPSSPLDPISFHVEKHI